VLKHQVFDKNLTVPQKKHNLPSQAKLASHYWAADLDRELFKSSEDS